MKPAPRTGGKADFYFGGFQILQGPEALREQLRVVVDSEFHGSTAAFCLYDRVPTEVAFTFAKGPIIIFHFDCHSGEEQRIIK